MKKILLFFICSFYIFANINQELLIAASQNNGEKVVELLKKGANPNLDDGSNYEFANYFTRYIQKTVQNKVFGEMTPLMYAARYDNYYMAKALVEKGANIETKSKLKQTALNICSTKDSVQVARYLIERGAKLENRDYRGLTPLFNAAETNSLKVFSLLLENKANSQVRTPENLGLPAVAAKKDAIDVFKYLHKKGFDIAFSKCDRIYGFAPVEIAVMNNSMNILRYCFADNRIAKNIDVQYLLNFVDMYGNPAGYNFLKNEKEKRQKRLVKKS